MKTREEALTAFRLMPLHHQKELHANSVHAHWQFNLFKTSTSAIQQAINKQIDEKKQS